MACQMRPRGLRWASGGPTEGINERSARTVGSNGRFKRSAPTVGSIGRPVGSNGRLERSVRTVGSDGRLERTARADGSNGRLERSARTVGSSIKFTETYRILRRCQNSRADHDECSDGCSPRITKDNCRKDCLTFHIALAN